MEFCHADSVVYCKLAQSFILYFFDFLNSNFFTALAGAFAGAYGGQLIVERKGIFVTRERDVNSINSAIVPEMRTDWLDDVLAKRLIKSA